MSGDPFADFHDPFVDFDDEAQAGPPAFLNYAPPQGAAKPEAERFQPWHTHGDAGSPQATGPASADDIDLGMSEHDADVALETGSDLLQHAAMGATGGYGDDLAGLLIGTGARLHGRSGPDADLASRAARDSIRARQQGGRDRSPVASVVGDVAGAGALAAAVGGPFGAQISQMSVVPRVLSGAGVGAGWGLFTGYGYSDSDSFNERGRAALEAVPAGAMLGAAGEAVGSAVRGIKGMAGELAPWLAQKANKARQAMLGTPGDYTRAAEQGGRIDAINDVTKAAEDLGVVNRWAPQSSEDYARRLGDVRRAQGETIGATLDEAGDRGVALDVDDTERGLLGLAQQYERGATPISGTVDDDKIKSITLRRMADLLPDDANWANPNDAQLVGQGGGASAAPGRSLPPSAGQSLMDDLYDLESGDLGYVVTPRSLPPPLATDAVIEGSYHSQPPPPRRALSPREMWELKQKYERAGGYKKREMAQPGASAVKEAYREGAQVPRDQVYGAMPSDLAPGFETATDKFGQAATLENMARKKAAQRAGWGLGRVGTVLSGAGTGAAVGGALDAMVGLPPSLGAGAGGVLGGIAGYSARDYGPDLIANLLARGSEGAQHMASPGPIGTMAQNTGLMTGTLAQNPDVQQALQSVYADTKRLGDEGRGHNLPAAAQKLAASNPEAFGEYQEDFQAAATNPQALSVLLERLQRDQAQGNQRAAAILRQLQQMNVR